MNIFFLKNIYIKHAVFSLLSQLHSTPSAVLEHARVQQLCIECLFRLLAKADNF